VLLLLLALHLSGCGSCAAYSYPVARFAAVPAVAAALLLVPRSAMSIVGALLDVAAGLFLVGQTLLVIDFAYTCNEFLYGKALAARRGEGGVQRFKEWQAAIVVLAGVLFAAAVAAAVGLLLTFPGRSACAVVSVMLVLTIAELSVSISAWCEHGALLTSTIFMAYASWLAYEALSAMPASAPGSLPRRWLALAVCLASLCLALRAAGPGAACGAAEEDGESTEATSTSEESESRPQASGDFASQCVLHAVAAGFVASTLAPAAGWFAFGLRAAALGVALIMYGWSLAAPKLLPGRSFR